MWNWKGLLVDLSRFFDRSCYVNLIPMVGHQANSCPPILTFFNSIEIIENRTVALFVFTNRSTEHFWYSRNCYEVYIIARGNWFWQHCTLAAFWGLMLSCMEQFYLGLNTFKSINIKKPEKYLEQSKQNKQLCYKRASSLNIISAEDFTNHQCQGFLKIWLQFISVGAFQSDIQ